MFEPTCAVAVVTIASIQAGVVHAVIGESDLAGISSENSRTDAPVSRARSSVHAGNTADAHHAVALAPNPSSLAVAHKVRHRVGVTSGSNFVALAMSAAVLVVAPVDVFTMVSVDSFRALAAIVVGVAGASVHAEVDVSGAFVTCAVSGVGIDVVAVVTLTVRIGASHNLLMANTVHTRIDVANVVRFTLRSGVGVHTLALKRGLVIVSDASSSVLAHEAVTANSVRAVAWSSISTSRVLVSAVIAHAVRISVLQNLTTSVAMAVDLLVEARSALAVGSGDTNRAHAVRRARDVIDCARTSVQALANVGARGSDVTL